ncbi:MAG: histidine kinase [Melioribacteraceae bacterium]|nr:histidine kinase [Melioribacteraceae bacterium]
MINPFVKNSRVLLTYIFIWIVIILIQLSSFTLILNQPFNYALADSLIFNLMYFFLGLSFWYPAQYITFENNSIFKVATSHITASIITVGFWCIAGYYLLTNFANISAGYESFLTKSLIWRFLVGIYFYLIIASINYVIIYYNNMKATQLKESEMKSLFKEAELKSLKYQINPHFIFNSLNSISSLTISDPELAREMTIKLSTFFRSTLLNNEKKLNSLEDELESIKLYLDIEKIRFEDKFEYVENLDKVCEKALLPNMILQPIFENAIKHGVYESLEKVIIDFKCSKKDNYLVLTIENNFDPESVSKRGEGIGLSNIASRLKMIYDQDNLMTYERKKSSFIVTLYIPFENGEKE